MQPIPKFLNHYAEPMATEALSLFYEQQERFDYSVVIPAFDETSDFITRLASTPGIDRALVVLVVNYPDSAIGTATANRTENLWRWLNQQGQSVGKTHHLTLRKLSLRGAQMTVLAINCASPLTALPVKQGVGLARKIGGDIALSLFHCRKIKSPWLYFSDADAHWPDNYFERPKVKEKTAAIHLNFIHQKVDGLSLAQQLYDLSLDYYVAGLQFAGSRYAHYSLGSALIINAHHYAMVRGFSKRAAGEDFYTLNKLAKTGSIVFNQDCVLALEERRSHRVPYGTGPATASIDKLKDAASEYRYYHPRCFEYLKHWLNLSTRLALDTETCPRQSPLDKLNYSLDRLAHGHHLRRALEQLGAIDDLFLLIGRYSSPAQRYFHVNTNFDGLKTLRLIHLLRYFAFGECDSTTARNWLKQNNLAVLRHPAAVHQEAILTDESRASK